MSDVPDAEKNAPSTDAGAASSKLRALLLYVFLVGLPLAGLWGILRYGDKLVAPTAVSGDWHLDEGASACLGLEPAEAFSIDQSGRFLHLRNATSTAELHLEAASGDGRLEGVIDAPSGPCAGHPARFEASVVDEVLRGTSSIEDCDACRDHAFVARRPSDP